MTEKLVLRDIKALKQTNTTLFLIDNNVRLNSDFTHKCIMQYIISSFSSIKNDA